jgi:hypothetical protein
MKLGAVTLLFIAMVATGCFGSSHAASNSHAPSTTYRPTPFTTKVPHYNMAVPENHSGFVGAAAKTYDAGYIACYNAAAKATAQGGDSLVAVRVPPGHAAAQGCRRGTHAVLGPSVPPVAPAP